MKGKAFTFIFFFLLLIFVVPLQIDGGVIYSIFTSLVLLFDSFILMNTHLYVWLPIVDVTHVWVHVLGVGCKYAIPLQLEI